MDIDINRYQQLYKLLSTLTAAEEAAIQQISPMISIVRLAHGNIGCKGNTSCVWQKSKLNMILPNLPEECKFIIITRRQKSGNTTSQLKSTKFERKKIQLTLELLSHTVKSVWNNITICPQRLGKTK